MTLKRWPSSPEEQRWVQGWALGWHNWRGEFFDGPPFTALTFPG